MIFDFFRDNKEIIERILYDIKSTTQYAHIGLFFAILYLVVYFAYIAFCHIFKREKRLGTDHAIAMVLLMIYVTSLLYIVFMSREQGEYTGINLNLWSSWRGTVTLKVFFVENVLLFIPMGLLLPSAYKIFRKPYICIPTCFLMSCFIETIQIVFELGVAEIDDVVSNTMGGAIGFLLYGVLWLIHAIKIRICNKFDKTVKKV